MCEYVCKHLYCIILTCVYTHLHKLLKLFQVLLSCLDPHMLLFVQRRMQGELSGGGFLLVYQSCTRRPFVSVTGQGSDMVFVQPCCDLPEVWLSSSSCNKKTVSASCEAGGSHPGPGFPGIQANSRRGERTQDLVCRQSFRDRSWSAEWERTVYTVDLSIPSCILHTKVGRSCQACVE